MGLARGFVRVLLDVFCYVPSLGTCEERLEVHRGKLGVRIRMHFLEEPMSAVRTDSSFCMATFLWLNSVLWSESYLSRLCFYVCISWGWCCGWACRVVQPRAISLPK